MFVALALLVNLLVVNGKTHAQSIDLFDVLPDALNLGVTFDLIRAGSLLDKAVHVFVYTGDTIVS